MMSDTERKNASLTVYTAEHVGCNVGQMLGTWRSASRNKGSKTRAGKAADKVSVSL